MLAAVGIQPNYTAQAEAGRLGPRGGIVREREVVALGETGLDRHWDYAPLAVQQDFLTGICGSRNKWPAVHRAHPQERRRRAGDAPRGRGSAARSRA